MVKVKYTNKSSVPLHGVASGSEFDIEVDNNGTPLEQKWRRRLRDSKIDNCIEPKPPIKVIKKNKPKEELPA